MSPIHGAIINWFAHKYGYINFPVKDTSKNFLPVDFLMMGESYHNNHHKYGSRANFGGIRWHEIDPTYLVIKVLDKIGVIEIARQKEISLEEVKKAA
jgi:stearoyl-CoA desaturase (delta-9 desaturase)